MICPPSVFRLKWSPFFYELSFILTNENKPEDGHCVQIKVKTRSSEVVGSGGDDSCWSVVQQRALEKALVGHPKGTDQRWQKIAKQVPDKTPVSLIAAMVCHAVFQIVTPSCL